MEGEGEGEGEEEREKYRKRENERENEIVHKNGKKNSASYIMERVIKI